MNSITASMGKKGPTWSREFDSLIRAIGECKSKAEEDALISKEVEILKPRLKDPKLDKRWLKELLVRLIYVEMLGQDARLRFACRLTLGRHAHCSPCEICNVVDAHCIVCLTAIWSCYQQHCLCAGCISGLHAVPRL